MNRQYRSRILFLFSHARQVERSKRLKYKKNTMCMSIYRIVTDIAYSNTKYIEQQLAKLHQSSSSSLLFERGMNLSNKAASTFVEQCGHVKLFSNH